ncbi:MAG TPA: hypothetical protein VK466_04320 [Terriglobales bacterium]|nr:hypothetical protein [Terriglobales bacterium]
MSTRVVLFLLVLSVVGCTQSQVSAPPVEIKRMELNSVADVRAKTGVAFDPQTSSVGKGALRVDATEPMIVPLFEVTDVSIENATLIYQASVQSENLDGKAFLEMWVRIPGKGEFFSRGLDRPVTGKMSWMTVATPFFLQAGQKPDLIRLNLVVQGKGRVWIDDIRLLRAPLPSR